MLCNGIVNISQTGLCSQILDIQGNCKEWGLESLERDICKFSHKQTDNYPEEFPFIRIYVTFKKRKYILVSILILSSDPLSTRVEVRNSSTVLFNLSTRGEIVLNYSV